MVFFFHKKNSIGPLLRLPFFNFNDPSTTFKMEAASNTRTHTHTHIHTLTNETRERMGTEREGESFFFQHLGLALSLPP